MNIYWGDLHNHCGITYGVGGLENALKRAKGHLDFCGITGHAMWPDIPKATSDNLEFLVSFHEEGFEKLENHWEDIRKTINKANLPNEFTTFQGYEIHSSKYGDYHLVSPAEDLPLIKASSPRELVEKLKPRPVIAIPHHPGYTPGYRGCNWDEFSAEFSPVVEVYSKHGCGMSDTSSYPYLHTMGPRDSRSVVVEGLKKGHRFGFVGSTDHHAGYPGSYGDGKLAVYAKANTREDIWKAILNRRTYAVTGDQIKCNFTINNVPLGGQLKEPGQRNIELNVETCDFLDKIILYKNLKPWKIINGELYEAELDQAKSFKVRIEMGWGENAYEGYDWEGLAQILGGRLLSAEPCFRGRNILAPSKDMKEGKDVNAINNELRQVDDKTLEWKCNTVKNVTTLHPMTNALILEIEGDKDTRLNLTINNVEKSYKMSELVDYGESFHMEAYNSEAVKVHRAVTDNQYKLSYSWIDEKAEKDCDVYHVEVRQMNEQYAWISPIFVES